MKFRHHELQNVPQNELGTKKIEPVPKNLNTALIKMMINCELFMDEANMKCNRTSISPKNKNAPPKFHLD